MGRTVVFWGTYDRGKPRTRILLEGAARCGLRVRQCHFPVWAGIEDKSIVRSPLTLLRVALSLLVAYPVLLCRYLALPPHDVVVVCHPGHLDILLIAPLAKLRRADLVWDAFLPLHETVVEDRAMVVPGSLVGRAIRRVEALACARADLVLLDTWAHAAYLAAAYGLPQSAVAVVMVGAETEAFPRPRGPGRSRHAAESCFTDSSFPCMG